MHLAAMLFTEMSFLVFRNLREPNHQTTMKKVVNQVYAWHTFAVIFAILSAQTSLSQVDSTLNDKGDIAFVAWSTTNQDGYAFVLLDYCVPGDSIIFTDEEWTGSGFYSTNGEGDNTWWNSTSNALNPGTVIVIENADNNPTTNIGSVTETDAGFSIAATDQIFAFTGTRSSPQLLSMIGDTASPGNQTLSGSGLIPNETAIHLTSESIYTGQTTCSSGLGNCLRMIYNSKSWKSLDSTTAFPTDVISGMNGSSLPVELLYFESGDNYSLKWATASEVNNTGFDIEVSADGYQWDVNGFVPGQGNSVVVTEYSYTVAPVTHEQYARLVQNDFDGAKTYSHIVRLAPFEQTEFSYWLCDFFGAPISKNFKPEQWQMLPKGFYWLVPVDNGKLKWEEVRKIYKRD